MSQEPSCFSPEVQFTPIWVQDLDPGDAVCHAPPQRADAVVIGSGYTGLNAALELVRGGREVVVLEAGTPGEGCSTRNGGQIDPDLGPSRADLVRRFGAGQAGALLDEASRAVDWLEALLQREEIACDFARVGRFHAAHTPRHYARLARAADALTASGQEEAYAVPAAEQRTELGSDHYFGGVVYPRRAALHPARYHAGLLARVLAAGGTVVANCRAERIERRGDRFVVSTAKGPIEARDVAVATNGYTSALTPWLRRRVIPIGSYIIATEPLSASLIDELFPTNRVVSDTRKVIYYYRASPDRRRVLFGGRVSAGETDARVSAVRLHAEMRRIFPQLAEARISHSWLGFVAFTFDELPHVGRHDGVHHALGYCGSGVALASYLGMRMGQKILGRAEGRTAFDGLSFPTRPLYRGDPWFLPAAVGWYRWRDRLERALAGRGL